MADIEVYNSDYTAEQIEDAIENGVPYINSTNKHWMRWDVENQVYVDTGIVAEASISGVTWGVITGTLSDQTDLKDALDDKVDANTAITGATKAKITYDSKGLVTSGSDLTASDIPSLDASKITSGTFADARIASAGTWNAKQDALTFDSTPTSGSTNPVTSGGIYTSVNAKLNRTDAVNSANTSYTTYMARGEALNSSDTTPSANGTISWTYS